MEADAALAGAPGVVVNDTECLEDLGGAVVHLYGNGEMELLTGLAEQVTGSLIQIQHICNFVKLSLSIYERIVSLVCNK